MIARLARRFAGPSAWMGGSEVAVRAANFAIQLILIRCLRPALFGDYIYAFSLFAIIVPLLSLGLLEAFVREGAAAGPRMPEVLSEFFSLRLATALASAAVVAAVAAFQGRLAGVFFGVGIFVLLRSLIQFLGSAFRAAENMSREFALRLGDGALLVATTAGVCVVGAGLPGFVAGLVAAAAVYLAGTIAVFRRRHPGFRWRWHSGAIRRLARSLPLGIPALVGILVLRTDVVMVRRMTGDAAATGLLGAVVNLLLAGALIPGFVCSAIFPALSRRREELAGRTALVARAVAIFAAGGAALAAVLWIGAPLWIRIVCGHDYASASQTLRRLSPVLVVLSPAVFLATVLAAVNDLRALLALAIFPFVVVVAGNIWAIPRLGEPGMAAISLAAQGLSLVIGTLGCLKHTKISIK